MNRVAKTVVPVTRSRWPSVEQFILGAAVTGILTFFQAVAGLVAFMIATLILIMVVQAIGILMNRANQVAIVPTIQVIERKPGLIVLVSSGELEKIPATGAIRFHYRGEHDEHADQVLQYLWLLCSVKFAAEPKLPSQSSYQNAQDLRQQYAATLRHVAIIEIQDVDNPAEVFNKAEFAYAEADRVGVPVSAVVADITGGTKSMNVGLAYAGLPRVRDMQFMKPRAYTPTGHAIAEAGSDPRLIDVAFVEQHDLFRVGRQA